MELLCVVILFLVVFAISAVKRYSPALWERARLPLLIFISIGSAVLILLLIFVNHPHLITSRIFAGASTDSVKYLC